MVYFLCIKIPDFFSFLKDFFSFLKELRSPLLAPELPLGFLFWDSVPHCVALAGMKLTMQVRLPLLFLVLRGRVSLCNPGYPVTDCVDQADFELMIHLPRPLTAGI